MKALLVGALVALAIVDCGALAETSPPPPLRLNAASFGQSFQVTRGQEIDVVLTDQRPVPGSARVWSASSDNPAVVRLVGERRDAPPPRRDGTYTAIFAARSAGSAHILLTGATTCEAMPKASCPDRSAQVGVTVS